MKTLPPELVRMILRRRTLLHWRERLHSIHRRLFIIVPILEQRYDYPGGPEFSYVTPGARFKVTMGLNSRITRRTRMMSIKGSERVTRHVYSTQPLNE